MYVAFIYRILCMCCVCVVYVLCMCCVCVVYVLCVVANTFLRGTPSPVSPLAYGTEDMCESLRQKKLEHANTQT